MFTCFLVAAIFIAANNFDNMTRSVKISISGSIPGSKNKLGKAIYVEANFTLQPTIALITAPTMALLPWKMAI